MVTIFRGEETENLEKSLMFGTTQTPYIPRIEGDKGLFELNRSLVH
jgi:hypothetical protein